MFWQQRWEYKTATWQGAETVIEMHVGYEERNSLDPMAGTTLKRNFQTRLQRVSAQNGFHALAISEPAAGQPLEDLYAIQD